MFKYKFLHQELRNDLTTDLICAAFANECKYTVQTQKQRGFTNLAVFRIFQLQTAVISYVNKQNKWNYFPSQKKKTILTLTLRYKENKSYFSSDPPLGLSQFLRLLHPSLMGLQFPVF